jgi:hypothetical protein
MCAKLLFWAFEQNFSNSTDRHVFIELARRANSASLTAWPHQATIAESCRESLSSVKRSLKRLNAVGLISRKTHYRRDGKRKGDEYSFPAYVRSLQVKLTPSPQVKMTEPLSEQSLIIREPYQEGKGAMVIQYSTLGSLAVREAWL